AAMSMPGMMDTVLNLGLNDDTRKGLAALTKNERFAADAYRRFISMFGRIVLDIAAEKFDHALEAKKKSARVKSDPELGATQLDDLVHEFKSIVQRETGKPFPTDPQTQLRLAIEAVFGSWFGKRAVDYRNTFKISNDLGTACSIVTMVFGNMGEDSGTGVAFTRDPNTGQKVLYGEYLTNAQGEDVVAGLRTPSPISQMKSALPKAYAEFETIAKRLEKHYRDAQDLAVSLKGQKELVVLVRPETSPDDFHGMVAATGILTARGGSTSHAAVVARGLGLPCVAGVAALDIDLVKREMRVDGKLVREGDQISIDGTTGEVFAGELPTIEPKFREEKELIELLSWADKKRRLGVWVNADTPGECKLARELGAEGVGLARTEHMFRQADR